MPESLPTSEDTLRRAYSNTAPSQREDDQHVHLRLHLRLPRLFDLEIEAVTHRTATVEG